DRPDQVEPLAVEGDRNDLVVTRRVHESPGGPGTQKEWVRTWEVIRLGGGSGKPIWSCRLELDEKVWQPRRTTRPGGAGLLPRPAPDVDGDGVRDLVLLYGKEVGKSRRFCRIVSGGSGRPLWSSPEERALSPPAFADADGDGALDLIVIASEVTGY